MSSGPAYWDDKYEEYVRLCEAHGEEPVRYMSIKGEEIMSSIERLKNLGGKND